MVLVKHFADEGKLLLPGSHFASIEIHFLSLNVCVEDMEVLTEVSSFFSLSYSSGDCRSSSRWFASCSVFESYKVVGCLMLSSFQKFWTSIRDEVHFSRLALSLERFVALGIEIFCLHRLG